MSTRRAALIASVCLAACGGAPAAKPRVVPPAESSVQVTTCAPSTLARPANDETCIERLVAAPEHR